MPQNDFLPFANGSGANVISQAEYVALGLVNGFQSGIALSEQCNKIWRQSSIMSASLAKFIMDHSGNNVIDDGTLQDIEDNLVLAIQGVTHIKATGDTNFYVNTSSGNDTNTGLTPSTAFKTIGAAVATVYHNWDFNGYICTINVANGTYNEGVNFFGMPVACSGIRLVGNVASPSSVVISASNSNGVVSNVGANVSVSGVSVGASGTTNAFISTGYGFLAVNGALMSLDRCICNGCSTAQLTASGTGSLALVPGTTLTLAGTNSYGMVAQLNGVFWANTATIVFSGGTTYSGGAVLAIQGGSTTVVNISFSGTPTGTRYIATTCGSISTNGAGANYIPGTIAGVTNTNGVYV